MRNPKALNPSMIYLPRKVKGKIHPWKAPAITPSTTFVNSQKAKMPDMIIHATDTGSHPS
jgi:hypothetical protein